MSTGPVANLWPYLGRKLVYEQGEEPLHGGLIIRHTQLSQMGMYGGQLLFHQLAKHNLIRLFAERGFVNQENGTAAKRTFAPIMTGA